MELPADGIDLEQLERSLVVQALERSGWNQTRAATLLGLNRDQIRYRIEKFKLERADAVLTADAAKKLPARGIVHIPVSQDSTKTQRFTRPCSKTVRHAG